MSESNQPVSIVMSADEIVVSSLKAFAGANRLLHEFSASHTQRRCVQLASADLPNDPINFLGHLTQHAIYVQALDDISAYSSLTGIARLEQSQRAALERLEITWWNHLTRSMSAHAAHSGLCGMEMYQRSLIVALESCSRASLPASMSAALENLQNSPPTEAPSSRSFRGNPLAAPPYESSRDSSSPSPTASSLLRIPVPTSPSSGRQGKVIVRSPPAKPCAVVDDLWRTDLEFAEARETSPRLAEICGDNPSAFKTNNIGSVSVRPQESPDLDRDAAKAAVLRLADADRDAAEAAVLRLADAVRHLAHPEVLVSESLGSNLDGCTSDGNGRRGRANRHSGRASPALLDAVYDAYLHHEQSPPKRQPVLLSPRTEYLFKSLTDSSRRSALDIPDINSLPPIPAATLLPVRGHAKNRKSGGSQPAQREERAPVRDAGHWRMSHPAVRR